MSLTILKLWLISAQTLTAHGASPHDDQLFLSNAVSILRGEWLGELSDLTLAKGPGYPLWLALVQISGVRLLVAQGVLYVAACAVFACAVGPIVPAAWRSALIYLALTYNPASWADGPATRTVREGIYSSLTILMLGLAIGAVLRLRDAPWRAVIWSAAAGLAGGWFALTREEGVWLAPSLALIVAGGVAAARPFRLRVALLSLGAAGLCYSAPVVAVAATNERHYGVFETCETTTGYFKSAYGALTRVKTPNGNPLVPLPREARLRVYEASPTFRKIGSFLEASAPGWSDASCSAIGVCDDIAGGWFQWALRQALARAGLYHDGPRARAWYEQVAREIDDGCRSGRLDCAPSRSTLVPAWRVAFLRPLAFALGRAAAYAGTLAGVNARPSPSASVSEIDLAWFERVTNEAIPRPRIRLRGTVESQAGDLQAIVIDASRNPAAAVMTWSPAMSPVPGRWSGELQLETQCVKECQLVLYNADRRMRAVPLQADTAPLGDAAIQWTTHERQQFVVPPGGQPGHDRRLDVLTAITSAASLAAPVLLLIAIGTLLARLASAMRTRTFPVRSIVALALIAGVAARVLILALIEATSFPAIIVLYMSPAYGLVIAFIALILVGVADEPRRAAHAAPSPPVSGA